MKRIFLLTIGAIFLFNHAFAQEMSKDEKKKLKAEIKGYLSDLNGYKAKMQDIRTTLDSNDAEIKRQKDDLAYAATKQAELENKVSDVLKELQRCHDEKNSLNGRLLADGDSTMYPESLDSSGDKYVTIAQSDDYSHSGTNGNANNSSANKAQPSKNNSANAASETGNLSESTGSEITSSGIVYKVQFGLYKKFNITKYFNIPKHIGYETEDGLNRYVISDFHDEKVAANFVEDVRRMGIKDAFVAKYIDGKRV